MRRKNFFIAVLIIILFFIILAVLFLLRVSLTGRVIEKNQLGLRVVTKAICNESNVCQDYKIVCKNTTVVNISPISGAVVQHPSDWEDPRAESDKDLCR